MAVHGRQGGHAHVTVDPQAPPVPRHHKPRGPPAAATAVATGTTVVGAGAGAATATATLTLTPKEAAPLAPSAADAPLAAAQLSPSFVEYPSSGVMGMLGGSQRHGNSPEVKRATIVGNPMFSAMEGVADLADDFRPKEDLLGLDDFNLTMDYDQLVEYFDNLKESNA